MAMVFFFNPATSPGQRETTELFQPINLYSLENNAEYQGLDFTKQIIYTQENNLYDGRLKRLQSTTTYNAK